jgi:hypothetical protein
VRPAAIATRATRARTPGRAALVVFCSRVLVPVSIVAICTGIVAVIIAGPWALAYIPLYILATVPGWPLGRALFGRRHPASYVSGALIGYALTCMAFWAVLALHVASAATFVLAWALVSGTIWALIRQPEALIKLPAWTPPEARTLVLLLLLVPAVFVLPYKNLGARDAEGNRFYRAYFTADFIWHMALTAELTKYAMPPVNPYLGDRTIQYYWTYFLVPAVISEEGVGGLKEIEASLKVNALCSGVLFIAALIIATWAASLSAVGTAFAIVLAVVAASAEGLYALWELYSRGRPLEGLTVLNIDAMSNWRFRGLRVDSLVRSMWYNPQHSMSAALGLLAMPIVGAAGVSAPIGAIVLAGVALALSTTFNPLIGGLFSLIYGGVVFADAIRTRQIKPLPQHAMAAALVGVAVAWCVTNDMVEGAAAVVLYGFGGNARNSPIVTLMLSLGPLIVPAVLGIWPPWRLPRSAWPAVAGTVLGLLVFYLVRLSVEDSYIGFRAGQLLQLALPGLAALFFARLWSLDVARGRRWRAAAVATAVALIVIGLPTTLIDTYNAQDIGNRRMGPGFRWTVTLTPDEQEAYRWMRTETPRDAIVQMDPIAHGRETWSQLPTFAWRRMAAARPISLMDIPDYTERSRKAHRIYAERNAETAAQLARELGIDYIFIGPAEQRANSAASLAKFAKRTDLFNPVFANAGTRIYEVRP